MFWRAELRWRPRLRGPERGRLLWPLAPRPGAEGGRSIATGGLGWRWVGIAVPPFVVAVSDGHVEVNTSRALEEPNDSRVFPLPLLTVN